MLESQLITKLQEFKKIQPTRKWVDFLFERISLKAEPKETKVVIPYKIKAVEHSFLNPKFRVAFATFGVFFVLTGVVAFAQNSLPGDSLYRVKLLTQDIKVAIAPSKEKPIVKMEINKERLNDLSKVKTETKDTIALANKLKQEINSIPQEISKLEKKQVVLDVSQKVKQQNDELKSLIKKTNLDEKIKNDLNNSIDNSQNKVFTLITETEEFVNNCPNYLKEKVQKIQEYFGNPDNISGFMPEDIIKIKSLVLEAIKFMKAGNCLEAIEKIESIDQILQIHSLETSSSTLGVEEVSVETLAPTPELDSGSGESIPEN